MAVCVCLKWDFKIPSPREASIVAKLLVFFRKLTNPSHVSSRNSISVFILNAPPRCSKAGRWLDPTPSELPHPWSNFTIWRPSVAKSLTEHHQEKNATSHSSLILIYPLASPVSEGMSECFVFFILLRALCGVQWGQHGWQCRVFKLQREAQKSQEAANLIPILCKTGMCVSVIRRIVTNHGYQPFSIPLLCHYVQHRHTIIEKGMFELVSEDFKQALNAMLTRLVAFGKAFFF